MQALLRFQKRRDVKKLTSILALMITFCSAIACAEEAQTYPGVLEVVKVGNSQALWMPAETLEMANTGTTVIRGSMTEIKRIKAASLSIEIPASAPTAIPVMPAAEVSPAVAAPTKETDAKV